MSELKFPKPYQHEHEKVCNVNELYELKQTFGEKASDWATSKIGSWGFIAIQSIILVLWVLLNITAWINNWDPYPFILLNLILSCVAAIQAPIILMSQNRQAQKEKLKLDYDYTVNKKAEKEIEEIQKQLDRIERKLR